MVPADAPEHPRPHGRPAERHALAGRPGRVAARAEPAPPRPALDAVRQRLHSLAALRPGAGQLHVRPAAPPHARLRQRRRVRLGHPDLCPPSAARRLSHRAVGQDALRRPRPAARARGAADDRHLPCGFRLDARLPPPRRAHRLVVSQPGLGDWRGRGRDHQPAGIRRRGRLPRRPPPLRLRPRGRRALVPDGQLHPPARPLCRPPPALGPLRGLRPPRPGGRRHSLRSSRTRTAAACSTPRTGAPSRSRPSTSPAPGAAISPRSATSTRRSARSWRRSRRRGRRRPSSSSRTMATCWASAASGSR